MYFCCRGLYSLVDWNITDFYDIRCRQVEAYTASWIEITHQYRLLQFLWSRLIQPRGLKSYCSMLVDNGMCRGLYSLVDWNACAPKTGTTRRSRGLYSLVDWNTRETAEIIRNRGRGLYSLVDWNCKECPQSGSGRGRGLYSLVDWNVPDSRGEKMSQSRGLYSLVDWNPFA